MVNELPSKWGKDVDVSKAHQEYPRPQLVRENWMNLNGFWDYAIAKDDEKVFQADGKIAVPFSPETVLSQVGKRVEEDETLWYKTLFSTEYEPGHRILLHFGAVDQYCEVWVNDEYMGEHEGGYLPFQFDITHALQFENTLEVKVKDYTQKGKYAYGKQNEKKGGIWYTPQSGIWQTVWLEKVPETYVTNYDLDIDFDQKRIRITCGFNQAFSESIACNIYSDDEHIAKMIQTEPTFSYTFDEKDFIPWTPDDPHLYTFSIKAGPDEFSGYFGMRKFSIINKNGHQITALNNEPFFHNGLLDQGYTSDSLYTYPSDEAMVEELKEIKHMGFNMVRKHIKVEPLRWYHHCDRLGIVVWQDFVNGGNPYNSLDTQVLPFIGIHLPDPFHLLFGRRNKEQKRFFEQEIKETIHLLKNTVSIAVWVPFNEGWGQFDAKRISQKIKELDPSRLVDHASGWHDQKAGDFNSYHIYYKKVKMKNDKKRALVLSEFGGYSVPTEHHMYSNKKFGYKVFDDHEEFNRQFLHLYEDEVIPHIEQGLCASVYTQVSDVEEEINGLFTFDREVNKMDVPKIQRLNQKLIDTFQRFHR